MKKDEKVTVATAGALHKARDARLRNGTKGTTGEKQGVL